MFQRYALYYTPAQGTRLAQFGASWLGWDSFQGRGIAYRDVAGLSVQNITERPRKYGFHATLKPPFRLIDGATEDALAGHLEAFASTAKPVTLTGLELRMLGSFFALCPIGDAPDLTALATRVVQEFDDFRAPPNKAELAKRRAQRLSPGQEAMLKRWGYPYVLDEFRFHMTLTGRVDRAERTVVEGILQGLTADLPLSPHVIDSVTLLGEASDRHFHQIERFALSA